MNATVVGLLTGLALGFAGYFGGFGALVVVAVMGAAGLIVGYLVRGGDARVTDFFRRRDSREPQERFEPRRTDTGPRTRDDYGSRTRTDYGSTTRTDYRDRVR